MDIVTAAASYLKDPLVLVGLIMFSTLLGARQLARSGVIPRPPASPGALGLTLSHGFVLGLVVLAVGVYLESVEQSATTSAPAPNTVREVDFGFAELDPGKSVAVPSYKYGGAMMLFSGEAFEYRAQYDGPMPPLQLRVGEAVQSLPGAAGKITIVGPPNRPLPAVLLAGGSRLSLPGGAPPRIAVKVQVFGVDRPR